MNNEPVTSFLRMIQMHYGEHGVSSRAEDG